MSAVVKIKNRDGNFVRARILLDTCASANFVTENFARSLKLPMQSCSVPIGAINSLSTLSKHLIEIKFHSIHNSFDKTLIFLTVPSIADSVPDVNFPRNLIKIPDRIKLADPQFHLPQPIDMLIGSGATLSLLAIGQKNLSRDDCDLYLQKTLLGWVVVGGAAMPSKKNKVSCKLIELAEQMSKFWTIEELIEGGSRSAEELACEEKYLKSVTRDNTGRYTVRLPFRETHPPLGESRSQALRRFFALENKFSGNPALKTEYSKVMQEYIDLKHMSLVTGAIEEGYYLPHHAVIKESSLTTRVRVVFDASAKSSSGVSLNETLMVGPTIQDKIVEHLVRFRCHKHVITADIEKMYRQIRVHKEDRKYQRILWRVGQSIKTFELNTVTFGVNSAPFLAIRTVHKLADDERDHFPIAAEILKRDLYVDDLLTGAETLEEVILIRDQIRELLNRGGFTIRQWAANTQHALNSLPKSAIKTDFTLEKNTVLKTLGVSWNARNDKIVYTVNPMKITSPITKRSILSEIARIFDPLGLLGPVILYSKIIMQQTWKVQIDWDESVPSSLHSTWLTFAEQLKFLNNISIDRRLLIDKSINIQIHGFCDASKSGYGACIYARSQDVHNNVYIKLICAKSKVAPLKPITIPRAELCAALLLARLYKEIKSSLNFSLHEVIFWSDSSIVLHWLKKPIESLLVFEANRVAEITETDDAVTWRHVRTKNNPADALSRGQLPSKFLENSSWFDGPSWLYESKDNWPTGIEALNGDLPGIKKSTCLNLTINKNDLLETYSSYSKTIRLFAYGLRMRRSNSYRGNLCVKETCEAEKRILKLVQESYFSREIKQLKTIGETERTRIASLNPFVDNDGLLRVGGRIAHSNLPFSQKHPILLPSYHPITDSIIEETHVNNFHSGIQTTLYTLRHRFWLLDGKNQVRKIIRKCTRCLRFNAKPIQYKMGNLPQSRFGGPIPFFNTGIDFCGPIFIKEKKHRNTKRLKAYVSVFICMTTKAVHLEIVSDLTTEGFFSALRRFIGRRGIPSNIYTDNGTNFVGANNKLRELYALFDSENFNNEVNKFAINKRITWHFNPPLTPHFGGIWEAAVKSFKHHFKRVIGDHLFTFEEINTFAIEIEAILNSRPLCPISTDPNDPLALTPAHLLTGRVLTSLPEQNFFSVPENHLKSWKLITKAKQHFWKRWQLEYLNELQKRQRWITGDSNLRVDTIVIIIDRNQPCMRWQLGRVIEVHPGDDGIVRTVTVKTNHGNFKRSAKSLCPLLIQSTQTNM